MGNIATRESLTRYIDVHCTVCTPESFTKLIEVSADLNLHPFKIEAIFLLIEAGWIEFQARLVL